MFFEPEQKEEIRPSLSDLHDDLMHKWDVESGRSAMPAEDGRSRWNVKPFTHIRTERIARTYDVRNNGRRPRDRGRHACVDVAVWVAAIKDSVHKVANPLDARQPPILQPALLQVQVRDATLDDRSVEPLAHALVQGPQTKYMPLTKALSKAPG